MNKERELFKAISLGDADRVRHLLKNGADPNAKVANLPPGNWERSPLREAIYEDKNDIVRILLASGAKPDNDYSLLMATQEKKSEVVKILLEYNADPNIHDNEGSAPLKIAVENNDLSSVKALVLAGADLEYSGGLTDYSALTTAAVDGYLDTVRFLIEHGADANRPDIDGSTILQNMDNKGAKSGDMSSGTEERRQIIVDLLLEAGAVPSFKRF